MTTGSEQMKQNSSKQLTTNQDVGNAHELFISDTAYISAQETPVNCTSMQAKVTTLNEPNMHIYMYISHVHMVYV